MIFPPSPPNAPRDAGDLQQARIDNTQLNTLIVKSGLSNAGGANGINGGMGIGADYGPGYVPGRGSPYPQRPQGQQGQQNGGQSAINDMDPQTAQIAGLLASILKTQAKASAKSRIYPFSVAAGNVQQILPENTQRQSLIISIIMDNFTPAYVLLDQAAITPQTAQTSDIVRAIKLPQDQNGVYLFSFAVAPTNPISIIAESDIAHGIIIEGA